jgi:hypothetical protein
VREREQMTENRQVGVNPEAVRSRARGRGFWSLLIAPWPIGVLGGVACGLVFGVGMAIGIASGLAIALGLNFMWVVIAFEIDDGEVDDRARGAGVREDARHEAAGIDRGSERAGLRSER